jgi:uncharacterized membrane protein
MKRLVEIDFARGLAIIIMVMANSAPTILNDQEINVSFRFFGSMAAPLFIFLSGVTFRMNLDKGKTNLFRNSLILMLSAIFVDLFIWGIIPFNTFDVLYLISISQILTYGIKKLKLHYQWIVFFLLVVIWVGLSISCKFQFEISDFKFSDLFKSDRINLNILSESFHRMIYDGWFPLFPWYFIFALGVHTNVDKLLKYADRYSAMWISLITGIVTIYTINKLGLQKMRDGYVELFYPLTPIFMLLTFAWLIFIFHIIKNGNNLIAKIQFVSQLGKKSLFVYIFHLFVISYVLVHLNVMSFGYFCIFSIIFLMAIYGMVKLVSSEAFTRKINVLPKLIRDVIGI